MKMFYPELDYSKAVKTLKKQIKKSDSRAFQYKAFMALTYLKHPDWFNWFPEMNSQKSSGFFLQLSEKIDRQVTRVYEFKG